MTILCHMCANNHTHVEPMSTEARAVYMEKPRTIFCGHWRRRLYADHDVECTAYDDRRHKNDANRTG